MVPPLFVRFQTASATSSPRTPAPAWLLSAIAKSLSADVQVYVAAAIPHGLHSFRDELTNDTASVVHDDWINVDPTTDAEAARHFLFHDCDPTVTAWALTTMRLFLPLAVYDEVIPRADIESRVVVPIGDRTLRASWMTATARQRLGVEPVLVDAGHCPHVSQPNAVAAVIATAPSE